MSELFQLFLSFIQVGLFSIGGGYAALPLIQAEVVDKHGWLTVEQFLDLIAISQMTPGPIAINSATFVGMQIAGIPGAIVATLGFVLPAFVIVTMLALLFFKFKKLKVIQGILDALRPAVVGLIAAASLTLLLYAFFGEQSLAIEQTDIIAVLLFLIALVLMRKFKPSPILVMAGCGIVGMVLYSVF